MVDLNDAGRRLAAHRSGPTPPVEQLRRRRPRRPTRVVGVAALAAAVSAAAVVAVVETRGGRDVQSVAVRPSAGPAQRPGGPSFAGEARSITLGAHGLGPVSFGSGKALATAELTRLLGPPSGRGVNTACGPTFTEVDWGELAVEFHDSVFSGYRDSNQPKGHTSIEYAGKPIAPVRPAARTAAGIRLGDTLAQLRSAYRRLSLVGANRFEAPDGLEFTDNGRLSPGGPHSRVVQIRVDACGAY